MSTINTAITTGIVLGTVASPGTYVSPLTITGAGSVIGAEHAIYGPDSQPWTVVNAGTVQGTGADSVGVRLQSGGNITNIAPTALIEGDRYGIQITNNDEVAVGYVKNYGTISGGDAGVSLNVQEGKVVNGSAAETAALISGGTNGVYVSSQYPGRVYNYGTITGTTGAGVELNDGKVVVNGQSDDTAASISGGAEGILVSREPGTITNYGTITATDTGGIGVDLVDGGTIANGSPTDTQARIAGATGVASNAAFTITNYSTIVATGTDPTAISGTGVFGKSGGTVNNLGTDAAVSGSKYGVYFYGGPGGAFGTVVNEGTISGAASDGISAGFGADVVNGSTAATAALITGKYAAVDSYAGTVTNFATITSDGYGVNFSGAGDVINGPSGANAAVISGNSDGIIALGALTVTNDGTISSTLGSGVFAKAGGTVVNHGTASLISGSEFGIYFYGGPGGAAGLVTNDGTISGSSYDGISAAFGGTIVNGSTSITTARIDGERFGVNLSEGTATNYGTIVAVKYAAVRLFGAGSVINGPSGANAALISGYSGIVAQGIVTVANTGTIAGTGILGVGVSGAAGSTIANLGTAAVIAGDEFGIVVAGGGAIGAVTNEGTVEGTGVDAAGIAFYGPATDTVINSGLIAGMGTGDALKFGAGTDRLIVDPGAQFVGTVDGGAGSNTLELASAAGVGTISGIGTQFIGFGSIVVDSGATWLLTGGNTIASGVTLTDSGTLKISGLVVNQGAILGTLTGVADSTVQNSGTISGPDIGVDLTAGGTVVNTGSAALISGFLFGVDVSGAAGTVSNSGTITATHDIGIALDDGGSVTNAATGLISGDLYGVYATGAAASVINYGTITATNPAGAGLSFYGAFANTVTNAGTIANSAGGDAVLFGDGNDRLIVDPGAVLVGKVDGGNGVNTLELAPSAGSSSNYGTITGLGVSFVNFGAITVDAGGGWNLSGNNLVARDTTLSIYGTLENDPSPGAAGTLTVTGTILDRGHFDNYGTVTGTGALIVASGTMFNNGSIDLTTTLAGGSYLYNGGSGPGVIGVYGWDGVSGTGGPSTVANDGTISASGTLGIAAIHLNAGGTVTNRAGGLVTGRAGIVIGGAPGTVINSGAIVPTYGQGAGVYLLDGGAVVNGPSGATTASVSGFFTAIGANNAAATVTNYATIVGTAGSGVYLGKGGSVSNEGTAAEIVGGYYGILIEGAAGTVVNSGQISGARLGGAVAARIGVKFSGPYNNTLTNTGTIIGTGGGDAVVFGAGDDRLILDPGAVFTGIVDGGAGNNTLELASAASAGTITGIESQYINFGTIAVDSGADWKLTGSNTIASGTALTLTGTLADNGSLLDLGTFTNNGTLTGTGTLTVDPGTLINNGYVGVTVGLDVGSYLDNTASGTISASGGPAVLGTGGPVTVVNTGTIASTTTTGINLAAGGTVVDAGRISGGGGADAIVFGGTGDNLLVLERGYTLVGAVAGSMGVGATNTFELLGTGSANAVTADWNGLALSNFGTAAFAAGADNYATLKITDTAALPGTIVGFTGAHDTVDLTQISDASNDATATLNSLTNVLTVTGDNGSVQLQLDAEDYSDTAWIATSDGSGGTDVEAVPPRPPADGGGGGGGGGGDNAFPSVVVTANPSAGDFGVGNTVVFTLTMSEAVSVTGGVPTLSLNDGGTAIYNPLASDGSALVFDYTVGVGQNTAALAITGSFLNGAVIADGRGNSADLSGANVTFSGIAIDTNGGGAPPVPGDFSRDRISDVLFHDMASGDTGYYTTDTNGQVTGFHDLGASDPAYQIAGVGNFDSTGAPEILFQNAATGDTGYWITGSGGEVTGFHDFGDASTTYQIAEVGDFTGDGMDNVLFEDKTTGDTGYWTTNANGQVAGFHDYGNGNAAYQVTGVADFTGNGTDDVLWHNAVTGDTGYWTTNANGQVTGFHDFGNSNTAYQIAGTGYFDGGHTPEILFHDATTGDTGYWTTNSSGQVTGFHDYGDGNPAYQIAAIGDYNGDGVSDILWHNAVTGDTGYWTTNASGKVTGFHDFAKANTNYAVVPV